jgi:spermidine/putrescine transport system substrate-binding protein
MFTKIRTAVSIISVFIMLAGCSPAATPEAAPTSPPLAEELIFYDWEEDMPQSVLDAFTGEYGIAVNYITYETQEDALENIAAGEVYDVVVIDNDFVPRLTEQGLLAEIDHRNVPNFKNISANFRDLAYDPENNHAVPFNWGTTGLVIRSDLLAKPVTRWADLWQLAEIGKIGMRDEPRDPLGVALKALGYPVNTEDPQKLEAAYQHLLKIQPRIVIVDSYAEDAIPLLESGEIVSLVGWAEDALAGQEVNQDINYILPEEGPMLWGDNFVIPANSPNKYTAEIFINFLLRPEISAQIVNENYYASANEAARDFIDPEIRDNPVIFPPNEDMVNGEIYMPLSPAAEKLYRETWAKVKQANQ